MTWLQNEEENMSKKLFKFLHSQLQKSLPVYFFYQIFKEEIIFLINRANKILIPKPEQEHFNKIKLYTTCI